MHSDKMASLDMLSWQVTLLVALASFVCVLASVELMVHAVSRARGCKLARATSTGAVEPLQLKPVQRRLDGVHSI